MDHEEYPSQQTDSQVGGEVVTPEHLTLSQRTLQCPVELKKKSGPSWFWHTFLGVVLPVIALFVEAATGIWAGAVFNPIPTPLHVAAIALVPVANALALMVLHGETQFNPRWVLFLNGFARAISGIYSFFFLPLSLAALVGIVFFGFGLLPLSPVTSFVSAIMLGNALRRHVSVGHYGKWGAVAGLGVLVLLEMPSFLTNMAMKRAVSESSATRDRGLMMLRAFGSDDAMLRACYWNRQTIEPWGAVSEIFFNYKRVHTDQARELFYRTTGVPFNTIEPPADIRQSSLLDDFEFDSDRDQDHGGEIVGGEIKGLSLRESRIDATIDAVGATSYQEWILVFRNRAKVAREARTQIQLPPGGVVSRLTLWVNGVECEAAFSGVSEVRQAYTSVAVVQRRDPVLVTSCGPDRVMMQCFPVPANGGEMKIRIGITSPLELTSATQGNFRLPRIIERNFDVGNISHALWVESSGRLNTNTTTLSAGMNGSLNTIHGSLDHATLLDRSAAITVERPALTGSIWASDPYNSTRTAWQKIVTHTAKRPDEIAIVIDASAGMENNLEAVSKSIATLPDGIRVHLIAAEDDAVELASGRLDSLMRNEFTEKIEDIDAEGGRDNTEALAQAWDAVASSQKSAIIWIHAAQPVELSSAEPLVQRFERRANGPALYDYQIGMGPNRVIEALGKQPAVTVVQATSAIDEDLAMLFRIASGSMGRLKTERFSTSRKSETPTGERASSHVARLWAVDTVTALIRNRKMTEAGAIAARHQLVTPVSGAVVLESAAQYAAANLKPVDPATVPTVPEPEEWLMIAIAALVVGWMVYRSRRSTRWQSA